jgi:hypothetical protein
MNRERRTVTRQLGLYLEQPEQHRLTEETHEALIQALAELLLEAFGEDVTNAHRPRGEQDESEADV